MGKSWRELLFVDDDEGIKLNSLANTVDEALLRYDIDAKTWCHFHKHFMRVTYLR